MSFIKEFIDNQAHLHLIVNFILVVVIGIFSFTGALIASAIVSIGKETWDKYFGTGWSWIDILGDLMGILLGVLVLASLGVS